MITSERTSLLVSLTGSRLQIMSFSALKFKISSERLAWGCPSLSSPLLVLLVNSPYETSSSSVSRSNNSPPERKLLMPCLLLSRLGFLMNPKQLQQPIILSNETLLLNIGACTLDELSVDMSTKKGKKTLLTENLQKKIFFFQANNNKITTLQSKHSINLTHLKWPKQIS